MTLTRDNISEWKQELNRIAEPYFGKDFSETITDDEWLEMYEGETPQDAINEELWASQ